MLKFFKTLLVLVALLVIAAFAFWFFEGDEVNLLGGDKDKNGCIGSAGYSWCEAKDKCLREWEEKCE